MKTIIVYYSFSKNNELLAKEIQRRTGADLFRIIEKRKRTGFTIFLDILFQRTPEIQDFYHPMNYYDHYILVAPVWAGRVASPLKSFVLSEHKKMTGIFPDNPLRWEWSERETNRGTHKTCRPCT